MRLVLVEGNISAGKSTLLGELEIRGYTVLYEDVAKFAPELERFYVELSRDACWNLQRKIVEECAGSALSLVELAYSAGTVAETNKKDDVIFVERSSYSSAAIFGEVNKEAGLLAESDVVELRRRHEAIRYVLAAAFPETITAYLRTSPSECRIRATSRARREEKEIEASLFVRVHEKHDAVLLAGHHSCALELSDVAKRYGEAVVVDGDQPPDEVASALLRELSLMAPRMSSSTAST